MILRKTSVETLDVPAAPFPLAKISVAVPFLTTGVDKTDPLNVRRHSQNKHLLRRVCGSDELKCPVDLFSFKRDF